MMVHSFVSLNRFVKCLSPEHNFVGRWYIQQCSYEHQSGLHFILFSILRCQLQVNWNRLYWKRDWKDIQAFACNNQPFLVVEVLSCVLFDCLHLRLRWLLFQLKCPKEDFYLPISSTLIFDKTDDLTWSDFFS